MPAKIKNTLFSLLANTISKALAIISPNPKKDATEPIDKHPAIKNIMPKLIFQIFLSDSFPNIGSIANHGNKIKTTALLMPCIDSVHNNAKTTTKKIAADFSLFVIGSNSEYF